MSLVSEALIKGDMIILARWIQAHSLSVEELAEILDNVGYQAQRQDSGHEGNALELNYREGLGDRRAGRGRREKGEATKSQA